MAETVRKRSRSGRVASAVLVALASAAGAKWIVQERQPTHSEQELDDAFRRLKERGYTINPSLDARYRPGTLLQTKEALPSGEVRQLDTPIVLAWGDVCFPDAKPRRDALPLRSVAGNSGSSLALGAAHVRDWLPELALSADAIRKYSLSFPSPATLTYAKGDLTGKFSKACVSAYQREVRRDPPEWFEIVIESVVSKGAKYTLQWSGSVDEKLRLAASEAAGHKLADVAAAVGDRSVSGYKVMDASATQTELAVEEEIVLAYRTRPIDIMPPSDAVAGEADLEMRDRPASETRESLLEGEVAVEREGQRVSVEDTFHSGDRLRLIVKANADSLAYVSTSDSNADLFHVGSTAGQTNRVPKGEERFLPSVGHFVLDEKAGTEHLLLTIKKELATAKSGTDTAPEPHVQLRVRGNNEPATRGVSFRPDPAKSPFTVFKAPSEGDRSTAVFQLHLKHVPR